jgi:hypothetical protein
LPIKGVGDTLDGLEAAGAVSELGLGKISKSMLPVTVQFGRLVIDQIIEVIASNRSKKLASSKARGDKESNMDRTGDFPTRLSLGFLY